MWVVHLGTQRRRRWAAVVAAIGVLGLVRWGLHTEGAGLGTARVPSVIAQLRVPTDMLALTADLRTGTPDLGPALEQGLEAESLEATFFISPNYAASHTAFLHALVTAGNEVDVLAPGAPDGPISHWAAVVGASSGVRPLFLRPRTLPAGTALLRSAAAAGLGVVSWSHQLDLGAPLADQLAPGAVLRLPSTPLGTQGLAALAQALEQGGFASVTLADLVATSEGGAGLILPATP